MGPMWRANGENNWSQQTAPELATLPGFGGQIKPQDNSSAFNSCPELPDQLPKTLIGLIIDLFAFFWNTCEEEIEAWLIKVEN